MFLEMQETGSYGSLCQGNKKVDNWYLSKMSWEALVHKKSIG